MTSDEIFERGEQPEPMAKKKGGDPLDPVGIRIYGEDFNGYQKVEEYKDLLPAFKELYYIRRVADSKCTLTSILKEFNNEIADEGRKFHPYSTGLRGWRNKWDKDILQKKGMYLTKITTKKHVQQVMRTRAAGDENAGIVDYGVPGYDQLEQGLQTMGGELMNDAMQMLRDDQDSEEMFESDELMKRKNHVLNVFSHVTKMVHGKASLMLKVSQDKRESANFMMTMMREASAGVMTVEEIQTLKKTYEPKPIEYATEPVN